MAGLPEPRSLEELDTFIKNSPTADPSEKARRRALREKIEEKLTKQAEEAAALRVQLAADKDRKENGNKKNKIKGDEKEDDINHINVNGKRGVGVLEDGDDVAVDNFGQVWDPLGGEEARRRFNGVVEGPNGAINAITQKWMNNEIDDNMYKELLQALKDSGAAKGGSVSVPAKKKQKK